MESRTLAIVGIVSLMVAGLAAVVIIIVTTSDDADGQRQAALVAGVFAFIAPTVAALIAYLRADDAANTATSVRKQLDSPSDIVQGPLP